MVKLEEADGYAKFISPQYVVSIRSGGDNLALVETVRDIEEVKGTPEEVHAALFQKETGFGFSDTQRNEAMLRVLNWVAGTVIGAPLWVQEDARKALGAVTP